MSRRRTRKTRAGGRSRSYALAAAALACAGLIYGADRRFDSGGKIAGGVSVAGVPLGGHAPGAAASVLSKRIPESTVVRLNPGKSGKPMNLPAKHVGLGYDIRRGVSDAYLVGRKGWIGERYADRWRARSSGVNLPLFANYNKGALRWVLLNTAAERYELKPKDASIVADGGKLFKYRGQSGIAIDVPASLARAEAFQVTAPATSVELPVILKEARPSVTLEDLAPIDSVLAAYTTRYNPGQRDRSTNVRLAAKAVDGAIVKAGETFSYNGRVGPRVKAAGYRDAIIFVNGKMEPGTGGGICQVSSTLYNAALLAGLDIRQRSKHSMAVVYVPIGLDATVSYGQLDLKFQNPLKHAIFIRAGASGGQMTTTIYGAASDKKDIRIVRKLGRRIPYGTVTEVNPSLRPGRRLVSERGVAGYAVSVQRVFSENGKERVEKVSSDVYRPHPVVVQVGPTPKPAPTPPAQAAAPDAKTASAPAAAPAKNGAAANGAGKQGSNQ